MNVLLLLLHVDGIGFNLVCFIRCLKHKLDRRKSLLLRLDWVQMWSHTAKNKREHLLGRNTPVGHLRVRTRAQHSQPASLSMCVRVRGCGAQQRHKRLQSQHKHWLTAGRWFTTARSCSSTKKKREHVRASTSGGLQAAGLGCEMDSAAVQSGEGKTEGQERFANTATARVGRQEGKRLGGGLTSARHRDHNNPTRQGRDEASIKSGDRKLEDVPTEPLSLFYIARRETRPRSECFLCICRLQRNVSKKWKANTVGSAVICSFDISEKVRCHKTEVKIVFQGHK